VIRVLLAILLGIMISLGAPSLVYAETSTYKASWYGPGFHGKLMANGQKFNQNDPTVVAHKSYAFGTRLRVTNTTNGRTITVRVQDRGPFVGRRCLDFSKAAAEKLGFRNAGVTTVEYTVLR
jgi:rare lipoprotein A